MTHILLVCGGRDYTDSLHLQVVLDEIIDSIRGIDDDAHIVIIQGEAAGTDRHAKNYAYRRKLEHASFPADWEQYGNKAGPIRNTEMAKFCLPYLPYARCIAFWDRKSRGTKNMIATARKFGIPVRIEYY